MNIKKYLNKKYIISFLATVVAVLLVISISVSIFTTEKFFNKEELKTIVNYSQISAVHESGEQFRTWLKNNGESLNCQSDGGSCEVTFVDNQDTSHGYVIILHSLFTDVSDFSQQAYHFFDLGFNVCVADYLQQEVTMGLKEKDVLKVVVDYIVEMDEDAFIYIYGMGVGATTALMYIGGSVPSNVKGVIADSAYNSVENVFNENVKKVYNVPAFPIVKLSSLYVSLTRGWSFSDVNVMSEVENTNIAVLYIHGTEDKVVPVEQSNDLFEVTQSKGTKHVTIHGADHCRTLNTDPQKYWREVDAFIMSAFE